MVTKRYSYLVIIMFEARRQPMGPTQGVRGGTPWTSTDPAIHPGFVRFRSRPITPENLNTQLQKLAKIQPDENGQNVRDFYLAVSWRSKNPYMVAGNRELLRDMHEDYFTR